MAINCLLCVQKKQDNHSEAITNTDPPKLASLTSQLPATTYYTVRKCGGSAFSSCSFCTYIC